MNGDFALVCYTAPTPTTVPGGDADGQISEAITLATTSAKSGSISDSKDVDMYRIDVTTTMRISFDLGRASGSTLDSLLRLFDGGGYEFASSDDDAAPGESPTTEESYISQFFTPGTYYIGVSGAGNYSMRAGAHRISLETPGRPSHSCGEGFLVVTAEANSGGVVNWEITQVHEWTPGDPGGPHQFT